MNDDEIVPGPPVTPPSPTIEVTLCALPGCDRPITPRVGGRPRLYCSDAHRAEAHRRRVRQVPDTEALLRQALSSLEAPEPSGRRDAAVAAVRAEMAGAVATAVRESAEALLRAEEAEAAVAEREEELGAATDEATRVKDALEVTRSELAQAVQEATFERHAMSERREEDLALVRREHALQRETWDEERRAFQERYEATRYELAEMSVAAEAQERRAGELAAQIGRLGSVAEEAMAARDRLAGQLEAAETLRAGLLQDLALSQEALGHATARIIEQTARLHEAAEQARARGIEEAELHQALEAAAEQISQLREALVVERIAREAAERWAEEITERVVAELVAVREAVEGGAGAGKDRG